MFKKTKRLMGVLFCIFLFAAQVQATMNALYWTSEYDKIMRSNLDGTGITELVTGLESPYGIAIDATASKMYWTENWWDEQAEQTFRKISRANLDGTGAETLIAGFGLPAYDIALDTAGGRMYWTNHNGRSIQWANLDGTGLADLITGLDLTQQITLDPGNEKIYWTECNGDGVIKRANFDGTGVEDLITDRRLPFGIAFDTVDNKIYFTDDRDSIWHADSDGSGAEKIIPSRFDVLQITLDLSARKMYFRDTTIYSANLDGTELTEVIPMGSCSPLDIAVGPVPEPASILLLSFGLVLMRTKKY